MAWCKKERKPRPSIRTRLEIPADTWEKCGQCGHLTLDTWNRVTVNVGAVANGKTISRVDIGYDQANGAGGFRGHFDDVSILG